MRVTEMMSYRFLRTEINDINNRMAELQKSASSGKQVRESSDDPGAVRPILNFRSQIHAGERFDKNISRANTNLANVDGVLDKIGNSLIKTKEHGIHFINGSLNDDDQETIAAQVGELKEEILGLANSQVGNDYLFSGYKVQTQPFQESEGGKVEYKGDANEKELEIAPGERLGVTVSGEYLFTGRKDTNDDGWLQNAEPGLFDTLQRIEWAMQGKSGEVVDASGEEWSETNTDGEPLMVNGSGNLETDTNDEPIPLMHDGAPVHLSELRDVEGNVVTIGDLDESQRKDHDGDTITGNDDKPVYVHANGDITEMNSDGIPVLEAPDGNSYHELFDQTNNNQPYQLTEVPELEDALKDLDDVMSRVSNERGLVGATMNRLESSQEIRQQATTDLKELLSTYEDADIVEASTKLIQQETSLKAALSVTSRISRISI
ncbi:MAG: flagellar hook-associated protein FlgL, partial [Desulfovermiculus sp.]